MHPPRKIPGQLCQRQPSETGCPPRRPLPARKRHTLAYLAGVAGMQPPRAGMSADTSEGQADGALQRS